MTKKPGTHCGACGKPMGAKPKPGAVVYHMGCLMKRMKNLKEGKR